VKVLVICRPRPGVECADIAAHAPAEMNALRELEATGVLLEAYSPGGPGAILVIDRERAQVDEIVSSLPLVRERLVEPEVIELHPFAGLASA
jgi:hypothetical protein